MHRLKEFSKIHYDIGRAKGKMLEGDPHLERDRTVCQDLEKMLSPLSCYKWEDEHCPNSWFFFSKTQNTLILNISSVSSYSAFNISFPGFSFPCTFITQNKRFNVLTNVFKSPRKMVIFSIDCWELFVQFQRAWSLLLTCPLPSEDCRHS